MKLQRTLPYGMVPTMEMTTIILFFIPQMYVILLCFNLKFLYFYEIRNLTYYH